MKKIKCNVRLQERNPNAIQPYAIVDDEDYEYLRQFNWTAKLQKRKNVAPFYYVYRRYRDQTGKRIWVFMHREVVNCPQGKFVDHINHNGLDNRKTNLRICTTRENICNMRPNLNQSSKYKGVSRNKKNEYWRAKINVELAPQKYKSIYLSQIFKEEKEAAKIYDAAAYILYKEFAYLNFGKPSQEYIEKAQDLIKKRLSRIFKRKYRGVEPMGDFWRARITYKGKIFSIGKYKTEKEAALAYNKKAKELLGDKAKLNVIEEG